MSDLLEDVAHLAGEDIDVEHVCEGFEVLGVVVGIERHRMLLLDLEELAALGGKDGSGESAHEGESG